MHKGPGVTPDYGGFSFLPAGCGGQYPCSSLRAMLVDLSTIPDAAVLYTCQISIATAAASGIYPVGISGVAASDASGGPIFATGIDGSVTVKGTPVVGRFSWKAKTRRSLGFVVRSSPNFAEWFTGIHLLQRDGILALVEKYGYNLPIRESKRC